MSNGSDWLLNTLIPALNDLEKILLDSASDLKQLKTEIKAPSPKVAALLVALTKSNQDALAKEREIKADAVQRADHH